MKKIENIAVHDRQLPFTVPAGYFNSLRERVIARCSEPRVEKKYFSLWSVIRPQLAFAAGFALLVGIATLAVKFTASSSLNSSDEIAVAPYISAFDIQAYEAEQDEDVVSDDAIVSYLLCSGSIDYLAVIN